MATKKLPIIHASTKYNSLSDNDFQARLIAVLNGTFDNPKFLLLPVDKPTFAAGVERYGTLLGLALDGSKKIIAERVQQRTTMAMYMRQLAHAVEIASAGNLETFLSSGFEPKAAARPISQLNPPTIKAVEQGVGGELLVNATPVKNARNYEIRGGTSSSSPDTWTVKAVTGLKQSVSFTGLAAGTFYSFQVRAFAKPGFTAWSAPLSRMCI